MEESVLLLLLRVELEYVSRRRLLIPNDRYRQPQGHRHCRRRGRRRRRRHHRRRQRHHRCRQGHHRHYCHYWVEFLTEISPLRTSEKTTRQFIT